MHMHAWDALGTRFSITIWDELSPARFEKLAQLCIEAALVFDEQYSRFKPDSLVTALSKERGIFEVPEDLTLMLRLYEALYDATGGAMTPAIGFALEDIGYDPAYTLKPKKQIRATPALPEVLTIIDETHIGLREPVLLDLGALGKGYLIDRLYDLLVREGCLRFLIDGSGDIRCSGAVPIVCGLEHPFDPTLAIGTFELSSGALCASATNRRAWQGYTHYLDPHTNASPTDIVATWVYAENAALADGLATALFFADPESLRARFPFAYLTLDRNLHANSSADFSAELFT